MSYKPWDGRFAEKTDALVEAFTSSIDVDRHLYKYDIEGSIAHSKMMAKQNIITDEDAKAIEAGLLKIKDEIETGVFEYSDSLEDIHMHIESRLVHYAGESAKKLHTGRSRNDQVALDVRLYLRSETKAIINQLRDLLKTIVTFAKDNIDVPVAGYTHLQRAQPVLLAHHMMAYYEMFKRDMERLEDSLKRVDVMPLGSAALAGTTYDLDREYTASLLDFPEVSRNSMDSVSDRDFIVEFISAASLCMVHFSRISEELIIWSSSEFNFVEISDGFTTGSSIMPQKKNPDVAELVRGKTGRVVGNLMAIITLMKSLPLAYNRDMQEDKTPLFDTVDTLKASIAVYTAMIPNIGINREKMFQSTTVGFINATDMADYLVTKGMPFREAHSVVGKTVSYALSKQKEIHELTVGELKEFTELADSDLFKFLTTESMIERRISQGGTSTSNVKSAINAAEKFLG
jgi:argininosuccinate lyase